MAKPIKYAWTGSAWQPLQRFVQACAAFVVGQVAELEVVEERSEESHRHYFACIREAWRNLPEVYQDRFGSDEKEGTEKLRKWCLIKAGYRRERTLIAASQRQAQEIAALVQAIDDCAVVLLDGHILTIYVAKSQKMKKTGDDGMDRKEFGDSKDAVLRECAHLIGVDVATLTERGRLAA
jgi:hypothetical protein